jgi:hypothetical protein
MSWLGIAHPSGFSIVLLYAAIVAVTLTTTVSIIVAWTMRPVKKDEFQQYKIHERLAEIAQHAIPPARKSSLT